MYGATVPLPQVSDRRLAVKLSKDALRQVRGGHPWVFDGAIKSIPDGGNPGDLAVIFDDNRRFVAIGLYDPDSPIRLRVLHQGKPAQIDAVFFADRIAAALLAREELETDPETTAFRLINGENDGLGGLIVDRYESVAVAKLYSEAWFPHLQSVIDGLVALEGVDSVLLRLSREVATGPTFGLEDGDLLAGPEVPEIVEFIENGLAFGADLRHGHKTGHFLDQRDNRQRVRQLSAGKNVLDVFSCTGGFSVYAAAGGAKAVTSIDISEPAMAFATGNMERNEKLTSGTRHLTIVDDAYRALDRLAESGQSFDLVVVDPPSFAHSNDQISRASKAYRRLAQAASKVVGSGGELFHASCSNRIDENLFYELVADGVRDAGRKATELGRYGHALDHPVTFPQGNYLKAVHHRLTP